MVKTAVSRFAANSMHPDDPCDLIRAEAQAALEGLRTATPPLITLPATLAVTFRNGDLAAMATRVPGIEQTDVTCVEISSDDAMHLFRTFITAVILTRDIAE